jgi:hypothetical protein
MNAFQTDLAGEDNVSEESAKYFYEELEALTYFAPEAANRSAHSFGSKMQKSHRYFRRNL